MKRKENESRMINNNNQNDNRNDEKTFKIINREQIRCLHDNMVIPLEDFEVSRVVFTELQKKPIKDSQMTYKSIELLYELGNGVYAKINLRTPRRCYSFGITERLNITTNLLDGYTLPICLRQRNQEFRESEILFLDVLNKIIEHVKDYLTSNSAIENTGIEYHRSMLKTIASCLVYKKVEAIENGRTVIKNSDTQGPVFYPKLKHRFNIKKDSDHPQTKQDMFQNKPDLIVTTSFYENGAKVEDPVAMYKNVRCHVSGCILVDYIYISANFTRIQFRVQEVNISPESKDRKRFLEPEIDETEDTPSFQNFNFKDELDDDN